MKVTKEADAIRKLLLWHVAAVLLKLREYEEEGYNPTISELIDATGVSPSLFHTSLKRKFEAAGLLKFRRNPDRTVTVQLTEKGRKLAECLKPCREIIGV
ncbi:MAG: hypothetical protein GSR80_000607 [Desulfurococcales archaeon]|nr:hypothetical protein [Desulfurococcales archaeon]